LFELFSKPIKSPQKACRTYHLTFENGEPIFTLSEASRILEEAFEEIFGPGTIEQPLMRQRHEPQCSARRRKEAAATSPKTNNLVASRNHRGVA
jgi:hypothetical protein